MRGKGLAVAALGICVLVCAVVGSASAALPRRGVHAPPPKVASSRILVKFRNPASAAAVVRRLHDVLLGQTAGRVAVVQVPASRSYAAALARYQARPDVSYAEPDFQLRVSDLPAPNDPFFGQQWALDRIHAVQGWSIYPGLYSATGGVKIAVVDTGVWASHPDLIGRVDTADGAGCLGNGFLCSHSASFADDYGHGTHVSGIAAAAINNDVGVSGLAVNSTIMPVKVCDFFGDCSDSSVANGIAWASAHGARVINLSLGGYQPSTTICNAVKAAVAGGAVVTAATGNDGLPLPSYPAACPGALGAGATGNDDDIAFFSNWDYPGVFVTAPGGNDQNPEDDNAATQILSTVPFSLITFAPATYQSIEGTSMSTPYVSGLAALLLSQRPDRTPNDVARVLAKTADKVGAQFTDPLLSDTPGPYYGEDYGTDGLRGPNPYNACAGCTWHPFWGYGRIDVAAALAGASPKVLKFAPAAAAVGQALTIDGEDLGTATSVDVGAGSTATITPSGEDRLQVPVPPGARDGSITVHTPSGASSLVGFKLLPKIDGFGSPSGVAGADSLVVNGSGFFGVSAVKFGTLSVPSSTSGFTVAPDGTQITVPIPAAAKSGKITVVAANGSAISAASFAIVGPAVVKSFAPAAGVVGATITLSGSNLDSATGVLFGSGAAQHAITVVSPGSIRLLVPAGALSGPLTVTNPVGPVTTAAQFKLLPKIDGFGSPSGVAGTDSLVVNGSGFFGVSAVKFGTLSVPSSTSGFTFPPGGTQGTVPIPAAAKSGKITVVAANGSAVSTASFAILGPPTLTGIAPAAAPIGGTIALAGTNLDSASVAHFTGADQHAITVVSASSIKVAVPAGAQSGPLTVENAAGISLSKPFNLAPRIDSISPLLAAAGATLTIDGSGLSGGAVKIGAASAPGAAGSDSELTVAVPSTAPSGKVSVKTLAGTATSLQSFTGIRPPGIPGFTPDTGAAGSTLTVTGGNVGYASEVDFTGAGGLFTVPQTDLTMLTPSSVRLTVPVGAHTGPIQVETPAGQVHSLGSFTVPYLLDTFSPGVGGAGAGVTLTGSGLDATSLVDFDGAPALFGVLSDTQLIALVPPTADDGPITVTDFLGETAVADGTFSVIRASGFSPAIAPVGAAVTIAGQHLGSVKEVDFNGTPAASFEVAGGGTSIIAPVPQGATDGPITLLDAADGVAATTDALKVISIDDFFPGAGSAGTAVALLGSHFENATAVKFGTVSTTAFAVHSSGKLLAVSVPAGAESGKISVVTPDGTATSVNSFTVLP